MMKPWASKRRRNAVRDAEGMTKRRTFLRGTVLLAGGLGSGASSPGFDLPEAGTNSENDSITAVPGVRVGHFTDKRRPTGCTVVLFDGSATAGVDVRGSAPGTRETDLLKPVNTVKKVNAIVLSGGSAFGLDSATGVMRFLEERGMGLKVGAVVVPIVPAAILFDLGVGNPKIRPDADAGYQACRLATDDPVVEGCVGAGAGATVGKLFGMKNAMKSGIGSASVRVGNTGITVGAIVAVNAVGDIYDPHTGALLVGARGTNGKTLVNAMSQVVRGHGVRASKGTNTTIGIVATNATFTKTQATKIAQMSHDGFARTIRPVHTSFDGDTIFAACTCTSPEQVDAGMIGAIGAEVMAEAVVRAVKSATSLPGLPCFRDLEGS
ncbi:MAG TPA: P1 family peptidase [Bryobacteraceae bacterium]|nr:P1 family peptidase [Bryobacteraceae bacterium]